ncbi:MAG TPA: 23S rRNA (uracil(1939)-C(5))-methyltransferase RlmD [Candidatus Marinimicrobia bacterium]|nr:23S rRNA (uracil(1939)-C(5))-methyltransferase RlmD [Candidatus Neomarinimicrobiota bacterium]
MSYPLKRNQMLELTIEDLAFGGQGIARLNDFVIFFPRSGTPGQRVTARIKRVKENYAEAQIESVLEKSPLEITAPCPYFNYCGGCRFQNLPYEQQIKFLERQVIELYCHLGGYQDVRIDPIIPAVEIFRYRNKMEFAFSDRRWLVENDDLSRPIDFAIGLRTPDNYYKAVDIDDCLIAPPETTEIIRLVREYVRYHNLTPYNHRRHTGYLRHLVLRKGIFTDQIMVNLVTFADTPEVLEPLAHNLTQNLKNITSVVNTVTDNVCGTTTGKVIRLLTGQAFITDRIGNLTFKISPASFFQTNTRMAIKLYEIIKQFTQPEPHHVIWDLFCGTGSIALFLARDCRQVIGFEVVADAVADARENAQLNVIENALFICADLEKDVLAMPDSVKDLPRPDIIIVDPPRTGLTPQLIATMRQLLPNRIIYVSCNPATQVRDLKKLTADNMYQIIKVQPIDLFPHTPHIETVTLLERYDFCGYTVATESNP